VNAAVRFDLNDGGEEPARQMVLGLGAGNCLLDGCMTAEQADRAVQGISPQRRDLVAQEERRQRKNQRVAKEGHGKIEQAQRREQHRRPSRPSRKLGLPARHTHP